jgi:hypothetical protein
MRSDDNRIVPMTDPEVWPPPGFACCGTGRAGSAIPAAQREAGDRPVRWVDGGRDIRHNRTTDHAQTEEAMPDVGP